MFEPIPGEVPITLLRVQIIGCKDLLAKDRNGSSDPFVVVTLLNTRHQTPVSKRNVNPVYAEKEATFEFPIYLSLADRLGAIEMVVWDKDMLKKEYLGEVAFPLDEWFLDREGGGAQRPYAFDDAANTVSPFIRFQHSPFPSSTLGSVPAILTPFRFDTPPMTTSNDADMPHLILSHPDPG
jgi:phosphatidylserine decarboxylase